MATTKTEWARKDFEHATKRTLAKLTLKFNSMETKVVKGANDAKSMLKSKVEFLENRLKLVKKMSVTFAKRAAKNVTNLVKRGAKKSAGKTNNTPVVEQPAVVEANEMLF